MSTGDEKPGGKALAADWVGDAKALLAEAESAEQQLDMLDPLSPEEMALAQGELGANAGPMAVLQHAREAKRGRKPGSRNRRTEDFRKFIMQFGRHPAVTMMEIQATPPEVLIARSAAMDPDKRRMTYGEAQALRVRCAEGLLPFIESKMPVAVDLTAKGDFNLLIPGVNISEADARLVAAGELGDDFGDYVDFEEVPPPVDGEGVK